MRIRGEWRIVVAGSLAKPLEELSSGVAYRARGFLLAS